jgi:hypothetical protein
VIIPGDRTTGTVELFMHPGVLGSRRGESLCFFMSTIRSTFN